MSKPLLDVEAVMAGLGMSESYVRRHAAEMGAVSLGGRLRFDEAGLEHFLEAHRLAPRRRARKREVKPTRRLTAALDSRRPGLEAGQFRNK
jgi:hypothetical protein